MWGTKKSIVMGEIMPCQIASKVSWENLHLHDVSWSSANFTAALMSETECMSQGKNGRRSAANAQSSMLAMTPTDYSAAKYTMHKCTFFASDFDIRKPLGKQTKIFIKTCLIHAE